MYAFVRLALDFRTHGVAKALAEANFYALYSRPGVGPSTILLQPLLGVVMFFTSIGCAC